MSRSSLFLLLFFLGWPLFPGSLVKGLFCTQVCFEIVIIANFSLWFSFLSFPFMAVYCWSHGSQSYMWLKLTETLVWKCLWVKSHLNFLWSFYIVPFYKGRSLSCLLNWSTHRVIKSVWGKPKLQMWQTPLQKTFMSMASRFQVCSSSSFPWTHSCTLLNNQIKATWWIVSSEGGGIWFWKKYMSVWELSLERPFLFSICLLLGL